MNVLDDTSHNATGRNRRWGLGLLCVLVLATTLRLYNLGERSLWKDEANQLYTATYFGPPFELLNTDYSNDPPICPLLVHFWHGLLQTLPWVTSGTVWYDALLRLMPCFFGVLCVTLTFFVGRLILKDNRSALIGAFLFAISPFQVYYARELRAYAILAALSLLALIFLWKSLHENRCWHWLGLTLSLTLTIYTQFVAVWIVMAINLYFVLNIKSNWRFLGRWIVCNLLIIALSIPALRMAFFMSSIFEQATDQWYPWPTLRIVLITFKNFFAGYSPNAMAYKALFGLCGVAGLAGGYRLRKKPRALLLLVTVAVFPIAAYAWASNQSKFPYYTHRLMIASAAPCYLLVAYGIAGLRQRVVTGFVLVLITVLTLPPLDDCYHQRFHPLWDHIIGVIHKPQNREAAHYIAKRLEKGDFVGHRNDLTFLPFECYYLPSQNQRDYDSSAGTAPTGPMDQRILGFSAGYRYETMRAYPYQPIYDNVGADPVSLETAANTFERIWLIQSDWKPTEIDRLSRRFGAWLNGHVVLEDRKRFDGIILCLYQTAVDRDMVRRAARLADDGNRVIFHYPSVDSQNHRSEDTRPDAPWRDYLFTALSSAPDPFPTPYSIQFDWAIARPNEIHIQGNMISVTFEDTDRDGVCETLRFPECEVREGDTVRLMGTDYSVPVLDSENQRAALVSIPGKVAPATEKTPESFNGSFVIENRYDQARMLECCVFESAETVEAMTFDRSNPMSDIWVPSFQCDPGPPPGEFNTFAMVATLYPDSPTGETIYRDVQLQPGEYAVFARSLNAALPDNTGYADAEFSIIPPRGTKQPLGRLKGKDPGDTFHSDFQAIPGWGWRKVGEFNADARPFRIEIEVFNPDALPEACFNLDRVMFLPLDTISQSGPLETKRFEIALGPLEKKVLNIPAQQWPNADKRIDIICFDPASKQFRNIYFYLKSKN